MIDFKDEILSGEARYRVRNDSGDIINDNVIIEQITPVIQEGTPVNKASFNKIDIALREERFVFFNTTLKKYSQNFSSLANVYEYIKFGRSTSSSNPLDFSYEIEKENEALFLDDNVGTYWETGGSTAGATLIGCREKNFKPFKVTKLKFIVSGAYMSSASYTQYYDFQASNDGTNWDTLKSFSYTCDQKNAVHDFSCVLTNANYYKTYRIYVHERSGNYSGEYKVYTFDLEGEIEKERLEVDNNVNYNKIIRLSINESYNSVYTPIELLINGETFWLYDAIAGGKQTFIIENDIVRQYTDVIHGMVSLEKDVPVEIELGFTPQSAFTAYRGASDQKCSVEITSTSIILTVTSTNAEGMYDYIAFR